MKNQWIKITGTIVLAMVMIAGINAQPQEGKGAGPHGNADGQGYHRVRDTIKVRGITRDKDTTKVRVISRDKDIIRDRVIIRDREKDMVLPSWILPKTRRNRWLPSDLTITKA